MFWLRLLILASLFVEGTPKSRPNIVLVIVDDLAMDAVGAYRAVEGPVKVPQTLGLNKLFRHIPTPNLDQIAREGVLFTRAYTAASICSPSRWSHASDHDTS